MTRLINSLFMASSCVLLAGPVLAQSAPIRIGQTSTMQAIEQTDQSLARQSAHIATLEEEMQRLTGRVESLEFKLGQSEQLISDLTRDNRDLSERLARLEGQIDTLTRQQAVVSTNRYDNLRSSTSTVTSPATGTSGAQPGTVWSGSSTTTQPSTSGGPTDLMGGPNAQRVTSSPGSRSVLATPSQDDLNQPPQTGSLGTIPASALPGEAGALFELGKNRLINFDYPGAEAAFRAFLDAFGDDPQAGEAHYWLGEALYQQGDFAGSARFFTEMLKNYPDDPRRGEALVKLARSLREVGETERACTFLARIDDVAPNASTVTRQRVLQEQQRSNCK